MVSHEIKFFLIVLPHVLQIYENRLYDITKENGTAFKSPQFYILNKITDSLYRQQLQKTQYEKLC